MATSDSNEEKSIEKQKEECEKIARETFNEILAAYRQLVDGIR